MRECKWQRCGIPNDSIQFVDIYLCDEMNENYIYAGLMLTTPFVCLNHSPTMLFQESAYKKKSTKTMDSP